MPDPKNITEETTLGELREQRRLLEVTALRIVPSRNGEGLLDAGVHHATGFYVGTGPTEAAAIEAAFVKLRHSLLPEPLKQYLTGPEDGETK